MMYDAFAFGLLVAASEPNPDAMQPLSYDERHQVCIEVQQIAHEAVEFGTIDRNTADILVNRCFKSFLPSEPNG